MGLAIYTGEEGRTMRMGEEKVEAEEARYPRASSSLDCQLYQSEIMTRLLKS